MRFLGLPNQDKGNKTDMKKLNYDPSRDMEKLVTIYNGLPDSGTLLHRIHNIAHLLSHPEKLRNILDLVELNNLNAEVQGLIDLLDKWYDDSGLQREWIYGHYADTKVAEERYGNQWKLEDPDSLNALLQLLLKSVDGCMKSIPNGLSSMSESTHNGIATAEAEGTQVSWIPIYHRMVDEAIALMLKDPRTKVKCSCPSDIAKKVVMQSKHLIPADKDIKGIINSVRVGTSTRWKKVTLAEKRKSGIN